MLCGIEKMENQELIKAIEEYRLLCRKLIFELGNKFDFDISNKNQFEDFIWVRNEKIPRRGQMNDSWKYAFHGTQCGFHNKNGQTVEVELADHPNFRVVEPWFLKEFIDSTPTYKASIGELSWQTLKSKLEDLYTSGQAIEIKNEY